MQENFEVPDFSNDDFKNDKQILKSREEVKAHKKMIEDSLSIISEAFCMKKSSHKNLKNFYRFKGLEATLNYTMSSTIENRRLHVSLATYFSSVPMPRVHNSGTDQYFFGFFECQHRYPRTYIHKESIKEKLVDLVLKKDVDFQNSKRFSRNFQLLTEDKKSLHDILQLQNLDELADFPDLEVELFDQALVFRSSRRPVSVDEASIFRNLTQVLLKTFK